jgi:DNA-binding MarR family transcriptional regulator|tara:strand:+ start:145 stop:411 length:267 start_codon:yes stop_codon:yes gene_type:complete
MEQKILKLLKDNYGTWYSEKEIAEALGEKIKDVKVAVKKLYKKNGHIRYRDHDWRGKKDVKRNMFKYRDRTRAEQDEINEEMAKAIFG